MARIPIISYLAKRSVGVDWGATYGDLRKCISTRRGFTDIIIIVVKDVMAPNCRHSHHNCQGNTYKELIFISPRTKKAFNKI